MKLQMERKYVEAMVDEFPGLSALKDQLCFGNKAEVPFNLKNSVEPQRHRERRGKTKPCVAAGDHPSGATQSAGKPLICCLSLCLCVSVVRNLGSSNCRAEFFAGALPASRG